jgi:hypothetical protein
MKLISKPKPTPASIYKLAAVTPEPFALFIHLDSMPYCEVKAQRMADFTEKLAFWKRDNLASLRAPVSVRFFIRTTNALAVREVRF